MSKIRLSEADLADLLANNPEIELDAAYAAPPAEAEVTAIEVYKYTRPIVFWDDLPPPPIFVPKPHRVAWTLPNFGLPLSAWLLLACLMFFLWHAPIFAFAMWMFLCYFTPILSIGKGK